VGAKSNTSREIVNLVQGTFWGFADNGLWGILILIVSLRDRFAKSFKFCCVLKINKK